MLEINWGDVINILNLCKPYLIVTAAAFIVAALIWLAMRKKEISLRKFVRSQTGIALLLVIVTVVNLICYGPMSTLISLATGSGTISEETLASAEDSCEGIAEEGIVLLKNDNNALPLEGKDSLNVFGWASTNPCYGGTGSGAISDAYPRVTLLEGLENAGFRLNTELSDFYTDYRAEHPTISPFEQDWTLPEPPADTYSDELLNHAKEFSDTALIVISRTGAEHADLPKDVTTVSEMWKGSARFSADYVNNSESYEDFPEGSTFLDLSQSERNMIELVCNNFENVVLVYNGSNALEMSFVDEYQQIQGVVWCAGPGQNGFNALGHVLNGEVNPSGRTSDIFAADYTQAPYFNNIGRFTYDNMTEYQADSWGDPTSPTFVHYVEGIYVGYKFYETAAEEGLLDYDEAVVYPFGYGLSYTEFEQEMGPLHTDEEGNITFSVNVTNTGNRAGKDVVEVYYTPPYQNGGIEKASVNLVAFEKTGILEPGASETVEIRFAEEDMASYDAKEAGCYVLEEGSYGISIRTDSHNMISEAEYTVEETIIYDENNKRSSDQTVAVNQLSDAEGDIEYLSRADGFANYNTATAAPDSYTLGDEYKNAFLYNANYHPEEYNDDTDEMPVTGAKNGMDLRELRGAEYDDSRWEELLNQLSVGEMNEMIAIGGYSTAEAPSVGKVSTVDCDGPASINNNFTGVGSIGFPSATMIACTWNKEKALEFGQGIGQMADEMGVSGWYAPAMNIHRSPFAGRNFEYYSEDGLLSGVMAANAVQGAKEHGVYAYIKHFALNDQESNRQAMICTWSNEQATREIYLKPFEIAVKDGGAQAVMSAYNYIGVTYAGAKSELLNNILRDEWGFKGFVLTDYYGVFGYMDADQVIRNGGDSCLTAYDAGTNYVEDTSSATSVSAMRRAAKNIMYTVVNSRAYEEENINSGLMAWQITGIVIDVILAAGLVILEVFAIKKYRTRRSENKVKIESVPEE